MLDKLVITEIESGSIFYKCPACGSDNDPVKIGDGTCKEPDICPRCGFNLRSYREKERQERIQNIEENPYCQLCYSVLEAFDCGVEEHPQEQMVKLGYHLIDSIPQSIADCWWFTVDKFIEPLPPYLTKMRYKIGCP